MVGCLPRIHKAMDLMPNITEGMKEGGKDGEIGGRGKKRQAGKLATLQLRRWLSR